MISDIMYKKILIPSNIIRHLLLRKSWWPKEILLSWLDERRRDEIFWDDRDDRPRSKMDTPVITEA